MITVNSTILSYNKINQIEEQVAMPLPDSYIFDDKKSVKKLIPDLYDLDRLEDERTFIQRNSTPNLNSNNNLRNNYFNSMLVTQSSNNNFNTNNNNFRQKFQNIYSNNEVEYEIINNSKEKAKKDENASSNDENINKEIITNINKNTTKNINNTFLKENKNNINNKISNTENSYDKKILNDSFSYKINLKQLMKKDPNKNIITVNTSLYKPKKRRSSFQLNNKSKNNNNNNSFLKFEDVNNNNKEHNNNNNNNNNKIYYKKNIKQEILKSFRNSNSIFDLSNNNINEEKSNLNLNTEENENNKNINNLNLFNMVRKIPKNNNLSEKNFISKKNSLNSLTSKKFNFDCPTKIILEEHKNKLINNIELNNNNIIKKNINIEKIKFINMKKIFRKNTYNFFRILTFLDYKDILNLLKTNNKAMLILINKSLTILYYKAIKKNLSKYKNIFDLLKCSLVYSLYKESFKIEFVINIRFLNQTKININNDYNPRCYQLIYLYQYLSLVDPKIKFKTKLNTKKVKMYDYYTFDLYPEYYQDMPRIYISKESQQLYENNLEEKLVYIQPILPFKFNDKGIINFEIFSCKNNFINPNSIYILIKSFDLKNYTLNLKLNNYNNLRICEYENITAHWKLIDNEKNQNIFLSIKNKIYNIFENNFLIENIFYDNIGYLLYKVELEAKKSGKINKNKFGNNFNIIIKKKRDIIENEIKKNNLIIERRQIFEIRVGDKLVIFFSEKKFNKFARKNK